MQLLSVMEARARTFDHLLLVGLNRGVFPRVVSEDPLLPDGVRRALRDVLPELPVKREGVDEERFLFAQLMASSESVVLSWSATDDGGRARPPSPLVERLRRVASRSVGELEELLKIRQPTLSQQLAILRDEALVRTRREGKQIFYSLASEETERVIGLLYELYCEPPKARERRPGGRKAAD